LFACGKASAATAPLATAQNRANMSHLVQFQRFVIALAVAISLRYT
jgi:hypothetical protein